MLKCGDALSCPVDAESANEAAVAGYVAEMTAQLESMASAAGLDLLSYFLAMARAEGEASARAARARAAEAPGANEPTAAGGRSSHNQTSRRRSFRTARPQMAPPRSRR
jgi:hypothetical protein